MALATGADWRALVPQEVAAYMEAQGLVGRFCKEFGLETIAECAGREYWLPDDASTEREHTYEE
jgi:hypothetical protein